MRGAADAADTADAADEADTADAADTADGRGCVAGMSGTGKGLRRAGAQILSLQTSLQASLQTTALLSRISLVNYLST